jgi:cytochrome P450
MLVTAAPPCTPPGPPALPLLGARGNFLRFMRDPVAAMRSLHARYGEVVSLARGSSRYVLVFDPAINRQVLGDPARFRAMEAHESPVRVPPGSALARLFCGLTQMNGAAHQQQRRLMAPAFQRSAADAYHATIVSLAERRVGRWEVGEQRDLLGEMRGLTLEIAIATLLGLDPSAEGARVSGVLDRWMGRVFSLPALLLPLPLPGLPYRDLLRLSEQFECQLLELIARKRASGLDGQDVLSLLIRAHDQDGADRSDEALIGQIATLFVAGHEITARALTWTIFLLEQHPRTLVAVLDEARRNGDWPLVSPLLEAAIKESLRLFPPVSWWSRVVAEPAQAGPYDLPVGTTVIVSQYETHRDPRVFPDPQRFRPERWGPTAPTAYEYIPFSAGPRACLGASYAMAEMKLVLGVLLQRCRFELPAGARIDRGGLLLLEPRGGLPVWIRQRDGVFARVPLLGNVCEMVDLVDG